MNKIRVVIAGLGKRAAWGVPAVQQCAQMMRVVALVEKVEEVGKLFAREFGMEGLPRFASLRECLAEVDFDAVVVFTPDGTHAELVVPAVDAGKWVFVDKPLEISQERIERIVSADRRAGGRTFVGMNLRYAPAFARAKELIAAGTIGRVLTIQQDEFYDGGRTYFRRWNRLREHGGGLWITKSCHDFDIMYWMSGGARPLSVAASASLSHYLPKPEAAMYCRECRLEPTCPDRFNQPPWSEGMYAKYYAALERGTGKKADLCLYNSDKDTFDHGAALVSFEGGIIGTYTVNVVSGFSNRRLRVSGTAGTIDVDLGANEVILRRRDPGGVERVPVQNGDGGHGGADGAIMPAFADFVRGRQTGQRIVRPAEAAVGVRIGLAAQQSCDEGRVVELAASPISAS